jgi:hypothetical protein
MDCFKMGNALSLNDRVAIIARLRELEKSHAHCSACESPVDIGFMRKQHDETPVEEAMCLPCHLQNYTNYDQKVIDKIVKIGELKGWYH